MVTFVKESEITKIQSLINNVKSGNLSDESDELAKLMTENSKLKFRLEILNRVSENSKIFNQIVGKVIMMQSFSRLLKSAKGEAVNFQPV